MKGPALTCRQSRLVDSPSVVLPSCWARRRRRRRRCRCRCKRMSNSGSFPRWQIALEQAGFGASLSGGDHRVDEKRGCGSPTRTTRNHTPKSTANDEPWLAIGTIWTNLLGKAARLREPAGDSPAFRCRSNRFRPSVLLPGCHNESLSPAGRKIDHPRPLRCCQPSSPLVKRLVLNGTTWPCD